MERPKLRGSFIICGEIERPPNKSLDDRTFDYNYIEREVTFLDYVWIMFTGSRRILKPEGRV